jgi:hypothetical protein
MAILVYFGVILVYFPVLVYCIKKNLAILVSRCPWNKQFSWNFYNLLFYVAAKNRYLCMLWSLILKILTTIWHKWCFLKTDLMFLYCCPYSEKKFRHLAKFRGKLWQNDNIHYLSNHNFFGESFIKDQLSDQGPMLWSQFSAIFDNFWWKNWRFSQKPMLWCYFLHNLALFWVKNANFFSEFFGENI